MDIIEIQEIGKLLPRIQYREKENKKIQCLNNLFNMIFLLHTIYFYVLSCGWLQTNKYAEYIYENEYIYEFENSVD
jgi:hypothetical protein